ncbi:MAG: CRTAC1 family protein, partial [Bacteroidota bacterium]
VDYDNDGDLDAYLTNYSGGNSSGMANRLYRNDGGVFTRISTGTIVTDIAFSLSSVWGDYDNDGDQDVYVTNDGSGVVGQQDRYYRNNGNGTFTFASNALTVNQTRRGATAGDYDNDGDLDIFAAGPSTARALYRNDTENGNHWIKVRCVGSSSNRSAIGARIRIKATINFQPVWQLREISAQNSFNGQNSLEVHFGLGDATSIDSMILEWPRGLREVITSVAVDQFLTLTEGENFNVHIPVFGGWNIVSVPVEVDDYQTSNLFPGASSTAFRFQSGGGYTGADTLENGTGYWVKYPSSQSLPLSGREIVSDTIVVSAMWNLIGSISSPVPVSSIVAVGTSIVSPFYEYGTTGYTQTATLLPGRGYWVKVNDPGTLIITGATD